MSFCDLLLRSLVAMCVCECVEKGDGDDAVSVSDYVAQLLADLRQQPARVLSKKALSLNIVIKHCLKFC